MTPAKFPFPFSAVLHRQLIPRDVIQKYLLPLLLLKSVHADCLSRCLGHHPFRRVETLLKEPRCCQRVATFTWISIKFTADRHSLCLLLISNSPLIKYSLCNIAG